MVAEWELHTGESLSYESGLACKIVPRTFTVRHGDGRRLAYFAPRSKGWRSFRYEGVLRKNMDESLVPLVFGVIFGSMFANRNVGAGA